MGQVLACFIFSKKFSCSAFGGTLPPVMVYKSVNGFSTTADVRAALLEPNFGANKSGWFGMLHFNSWPNLKIGGKNQEITVTIC